VCQYILFVDHEIKYEKAEIIHAPALRLTCNMLLLRVCESIYRLMIN